MSGNDTSTQDELLTIKKVARIFKVSPRTVYRWMQRKRIKRVKFQGIVRIRRSEVERILRGD
jgi:excisionase family DNA binding protein